jgi:hypothetical protein
VRDRDHDGEARGREYLVISAEEGLVGAAGGRAAEDDVVWEYEFGDVGGQAEGGGAKKVQQRYSLEESHESASLSEANDE